MLNSNYFKLILTCLMWMGLTFSINAQGPAVADSFYTQAQQAFEEADYAQARFLANRMLLQDKRYAPAYTLISETYLMEDEPAKAVSNAKKALKYSPYDADALFVLGTAYEKQDKVSLAISTYDKGMDMHPKDDRFALAKAEALVDDDRPFEARATMRDHIKNNPDDAAMQARLDILQDNHPANFVKVGARVNSFSAYYPSRLLLGIEAGRKFSHGTYMVRFNQRWLGENYGKQIELDGYPKLADGKYLYLNFGYSPDNIFPRFRAGAEFYSSLPWSMDGSLGLRFLDFEEKQLFVFTGSLGKYYKNWWFYVRPYLTPRDQTFSRSINVGFRYYYKTAEDHIEFSVGAGENPDLLNLIEFIESEDLLENYRAALSIQHAFNTHFVGQAGGRIAYRETPFSQPTFVWNPSFHVGLKYLFK